MSPFTAAASEPGERARSGHPERPGRARRWLHRRIRRRMSAVIDARSLRPEGDGYYELGAACFTWRARLAPLREGRASGSRRSVAATSTRQQTSWTRRSANRTTWTPSRAWTGVRAGYPRQPLHAAGGRPARRAERRGVRVCAGRVPERVPLGRAGARFSPALSARTVASYTRVHSERSGQVFEPGDRVGAADDDRRYDVLGLSLAGSWRTGRWLHRFGAELRDQSAEYDYANAIVFEPGYPFPQSTGETSSFEADPHPSGTHLSAYATSRVLLTRPSPRSSGCAGRSRATARFRRPVEPAGQFRLGTE